MKISSSSKDEKKQETTQINCIKDLLILHNDSFENWRYLFEIKPGGYEYEYNFKLMAVFLKVVIEKINQLSENSERTFGIKRVK